MIATDKMTRQSTTTHFLLHNRKRRRLSKACMLLMVSSSYLLRESFSVSSSPPSSRRYHRNNLMKTSSSSLSSSLSASQQRGGSLSNKEEDEELDAYIEDLISTVETVEENTIGVSEATSNHHEDTEEEEEEGEEDKDVDRTLVDEDGENSSTIEELTIKADSIEEGTDAIEKRKISKDMGKDSQKHKTERKKKRKTFTKSKAETDEAFDKRKKETAGEPNTNGDSNSKSTPKPATKPNNESLARPPAGPTDPRRRRQHPPNALYRFLLNQGAIGHVLVMLLILCVEWLYTYLPPLANFLAWLWIRIFGRHPAVVGSGVYYRDDGDADEYIRVKATQTNVAAVRSRRTGQTGKQRRALTRQADEVSLAQLKRIGNVQQAKYKHVSLDFMQRHGLGSFAGERRGVVYTVKEAEEQESVSDAKMTRKKTIPTKKKGATRHEEEEEDVDWVIQALTSNLTRATSGGPTVKPTVSVGVGPDGVSVGVELSLGRRQAVVDAVTSERKKKKSSAGPRASDRDGGDGIFGRLRAATGANSLVSRSLLGAYPGDAVPPDEAASVQGVTDLAQKYGWGDWSDEDDDESTILLPKRRKRRKKRRVEMHGSPTIGVEVNFSSGQARPPMSSRRKGSTRESTHTEEVLRTLTPLSARRTLKDVEGSERRRKVRRRKTVRPALERISGVRKKKIDEEDVS